MTAKVLINVLLFCLVLFPSVAFTAPVDLFPTPVSSSTTLFPAITVQPAVDDSYLEAPFSMGFNFKFFGNIYNSIFLNSNGGITFGSGNADWSLPATDVTQPGVAVFWGDMNAGAASASAKQMSYEQFSDRFVVTYAQLQDHDKPEWNNSATATFYPEGTIVIQYGTVLSQDILVGVFDGSHSNDQYLSVQSSYNLATIGSGAILFDDSGKGPAHNGELNNRTLTFYAGAAGAQNNCAASVSSTLLVHIPIVTYSNFNYWLDLQYNSGDSTLTVVSYAIVSNLNPYSNCTASTLSSDFKLHIPVLIYNGVSYWADLQYKDSVFVITGSGLN